jgi:hypothetical protein
MLKRGIAATIEDLLLSAEYILAGGNYDVMLCERGIRTFETYTRNTMDISAIPVLKKLETHLPVGRSLPRHRPPRQRPAMARAAVAAGADGLLIEVHPNPDIVETWREAPIAWTASPASRSSAPASSAHLSASRCALTDSPAPSPDGTPTPNNSTRHSGAKPSR